MEYSETVRKSREAFETSGQRIIEDTFYVLLDDTSDPTDTMCTWIARVLDNYGEINYILVRDGAPGIGEGATYLTLGDSEVENLKRYLNK